MRIDSQVRTRIFKLVVCISLCIGVAMANQSRKFHWLEAYEKHFVETKVFWDSCEAGAPILSPVESYPKDYQSMIEIALQFGELAPGEYEYEKPELQSYYEHSYYAEDLPSRSTFHFTQEHRTLLKRLNIGAEVFDETGRKIAVVDCKRPYGDYSNFVAEMALHLGLPTGEDENGATEISDEVEEHMSQLHGEIEPALQVFLRNFKLEEGHYECPSWNHWVKESS